MSWLRRTSRRDCPPGHGSSGLLAWCSPFLALFLAAAPVQAQTQTEVPTGWSLIPSGPSAGEDFRLLIVTSTRQTADDTAIADYNTVVQGDVSSTGHTDIQSYSANFQMLGCTETTSAITNTNTASTDTAAPIYWLNGAKVADDYADLYDGSWDSHGPKYPSGENAPTSGLSSQTLVGCTPAGEIDGDGYYLGATTKMTQGYPGSSGFEFGVFPVNAGTSQRFYGLSEIFRVPANTPATGAPAITGTATVGQMLTASTSGIMDADGLTGPTYTYQWIRVDSDGMSNTTDIGTDASTYTLAAADEGKKIKVKVSFQDDSSNDEALTSDAYPSGTETVAATTVSSVAITSTPTAATDTYGAGEQIRFTVTFSHAVEVSASRPHFEFALGSSGSTVDTEAAYESGSGTTALVFAYTVQASDMDDDGIWIGNQSRTIMLDAGEYIRAVGTTLDAVLTHAELGTQSGHKVDGSQTPDTPADEATVDVAPREVTVQEGEQAVVTLELSNTLTRSVTVEYSTRDNSATDGNDYNATSGTLVFDAGETEKTITLSTIEDDVVEDTENFFVYLEVAEGQGLSLDSTNSRVRIEDDDLAVFGFKEAEYTVHKAAGTVTIVMGFYNHPVPESIPTRNIGIVATEQIGEAAPGVDYEAPSKTIRFVPGQREYSVSFTIHDDNEEGGDERFRLRLDSQNGLAGVIEISPEVAIVRIVDEPPPRPTPGTPAVTDPVNNAPVFSTDAAVARSVAENTAADTKVGTPVTATDADDDPLAYTLGGPDAASFAIDAATGQLTTRAPLDHETKAVYSVMVKADDGRGGEAAITVAINVTDEDERPETPAAPSVEATKGSTTGLDVSWTKPGLGGGPEITHYDLQYRRGTSEDWIDGPQGVTGTGTTLTVPDLLSRYQVRIRAVNADGIPGAWSEPGLWSQPPELADSRLTKAWLARFGRTVGTHVTDAVGERLRGSPGQGSQLTVGGYRLPLGQAGRDAGSAAGQPGSGAATAAEASASALLQGLAGVLGLGADAGTTGGSGWAPGVDGPDPRLGQRQPLNFDLRQVLLGSSFRLNLGADSSGASTPRLTAWGRFAGTTFDGQDGDLTLDGDVLTGTLGVDGTWDRWLAGVAVSHSRGDGSYTMTGAEADRGGDLDNTLTSIHPYLRYAVNDRLDVWGLLGYGWGEVTLEQQGAASLETDMAFVMGAVGGRGLLLAAPDTGGFQLATRTDAMFTRTTSDAVTGDQGTLASSEADAHRLRVILEGSRGITWADGRSLTPTMEVGLRHDWGDAETGFGLELGGRVQYADPSLGLTVEAAIRGLLAHEDSDYEEWGASGTLRINPGATGQGLSLTLSPTWGAAASGVDGLWSRQTTAGLAPQSHTPASTGQLAAELGYGLPTPVGTGLLTPYAGTVLTDGAARTYRLGTRLHLDTSWAKTLQLNLEAQRQDPTGQQPATQGVRLQATWSF